jgi:hypothetical protein
MAPRSTTLATAETSVRSAFSPYPQLGELITAINEVLHANQWKILARGIERGFYSLIRSAYAVSCSNEIARISRIRNVHSTCVLSHSVVTSDANSM